jgi:hypothetical protein
LAHYDNHRIFATSNKDSIHHLNIGFMKKKTVIILGSVVVVCGAFSSLFVDWPVDFSGASGDIAKATRFSREQASEKLTNMEELLQNDSAFKDGIVAAQVVMQTRAVQFASLVDMSNEVAGDIPAFAEVLKDMNAASKMVENVNNSLAEAGGDLNAALGGEERPDLAQNTINASLAYTTLQKQNKLATRFIETTDKYLATAKADDQLKFVRDQWLEYQQMTAALEGDKESAEALAKKGNLLSGEKALSAMQKFGLANQVSILCCSHLAQSLHVNNQVSLSFSAETVNSVVSVARAVASLENAGGIQLQQQDIVNALGQFLAIGQTQGLEHQAGTPLSSQLSEQLAQMSTDALAMSKPRDIQMGLASMASLNQVVKGYADVMNSVAPLNQQQQLNIVNQLNSAIGEMAYGNRPTLGLLR